MSNIQRRGWELTCRNTRHILIYARPPGPCLGRIKFPGSESFTQSLPSIIIDTVNPVRGEQAVFRLNIHSPFCLIFHVNPDLHHLSRRVSFLLFSPSPCSLPTFWPSEVPSSPFSPVPLPDTPRVHTITLSFTGVRISLTRD